MPSNLPANHAIALHEGLPVTDPRSLVDVVLDTPEPTGHDLLVEVRAVSVNPVDVKVRAGSPASDEPRVIGYDAVGRVVAVGEDVSLFAVGDEVWYAGSIVRPGTNQRLHLVHENIVGRKPTSLSDAEAAALPLTGITAWETLFTHVGATGETTGTLLVIGAAGGVGSILIQLAKALTGLRVIAVASRPESAEWVRSMGADEVVGRDFAAEVAALAPDGVEYVFTSFTPGNIDAIAEVIAPFGHVVSIDETGGSIDALKDKSASWHWELMFTRAMFQPDDQSQHELLDSLADLVDAGTIRTTMTADVGPLEAATLRRAHEMLESSRTIGKVALSGWAEPTA